MVSIKLPFSSKDIGNLRGKFQGNDNYRRKFKTTFIVEEEIVLRKKIVSIFEDEVYEDGRYEDYFFSNSNRKTSKNSSRIPKCLAACLPFFKDSSFQSTTQKKKIEKAKLTPDDQFYNDQAPNDSPLSIHDVRPVIRNSLADDTLEMQSLTLENHEEIVSRSKASDYGRLLDGRNSDEKIRSVSNAHKDLNLSNEILLKKTSKPRFKQTSKDLKQIANSDETENFIKTEIAFQSESNVPADSKKVQESVPTNSEDKFLKTLKRSPINNRYQYYGPLGEGTFGKVLSCMDIKSRNEMVAMKVNKKSNKYRIFAQHEVLLLSKIKRIDPKGDNRVVILKEWFEIDSHIILVFPQYGDDLYNYLKSINHHGMKLGHVRHISSQLWKAVDYLHRLRIIHTDIKPENLLFVSNVYKYVTIRNTDIQIKTPVDTKVVLIDLGNAIYGPETKPRTIVTRYYRPPEVYLETGWDKSVDVWSIGCVMFELYSGRSLFQCREDLEHLWMMEWILRPFPEHLIKKSKIREKFFNESGLVHTESLDLDKLKKSLRRFEFLLLNKSDFEDPLVDVILQCLKYDPNQRITTKEAIKLPFLSLG